jgi:hypothetical protein
MQFSATKIQHSNNAMHLAFHVLLVHYIFHVFPTEKAWNCESPILWTTLTNPSTRAVMFNAQFSPWLIGGTPHTPSTTALGKSI